MSQLSDKEVTINQNFVEVYNRLKATNKVEGKTEFCVALGMPPANFSRYEKNKRSIPKIYIDELIDKFDVSRGFIETGQGDMFKKGEGINTGNSVTKTGTFNTSESSGNKVSLPNVPTPANSTEIDYYRQRIKDLEQQNAKLLDQLMQLLTKKE